MPLFSFLLPTRKRTAGLYRFLQSVIETTHQVDDVEVALCVDEDDLESQNVVFQNLSIKTAIVPPGATLGELLTNSFNISTGRFVMFMNDDVVIRTRNWDRGIYSAFSSFGDDIGLVYVNDLLFRERLSIFPVLSRQACLEIGVCFPQYRRYRIDDHIFDTYNMLALMGYKRIVYLPDVVFEHMNYQTSSSAEGEKFISTDGKVYAPNPEILKFDASLFDSLLETRKLDALKLLALIEDERRQKQMTDSKMLLDGIKDRSYQNANLVRLMPLSTLSEEGEDSVTHHDFAEDDGGEVAKFAIETRELESICARLPLFQDAVVRKLTARLDRSLERGDTVEAKFFEDLVIRIKSVSLRTSASNPTLLTSYKGHNLVHYQEDILIVPQSLGPMNLRNWQLQESGGIRSARSLEAAKKIVDDLLLEVEPGHPVDKVRAIAETPAYNLVQAGTNYIAVAKTLGPTALFSEKIGERDLGTLIMCSNDLAELQSRVQLVEAQTIKPSVELVRHVGQYDLIRLGDSYVAVSSMLGPTSLLVETIGERDLGHLLLRDNDLDRLERRVREIADRMTGDTPLTEFVTETDSYNLVRAGDSYLAVAKTLGPTALMVERVGERELGTLVLKDADLERLRSRVRALESASKPLPELVKQGTHYNIVRLGDYYTAVSTTLGHVSLLTETIGERDLGDLVLVDTNLERLQERVNELVGRVEARFVP